MLSLKKSALGLSCTAAAGVTAYYYISDSRCSVYKYALKAGQIVGDAEFGHKAGVFLAKHSFVPYDRVGNDKILSVKLWGVDFPNVVGLAAGFDKNAECMHSMMADGLGFGFTEVGSITPLPQPGNPLPRVFRLTEDKAIINRYGFNSDGVEIAANNLEIYRSKRIAPSNINAAEIPHGVVGVNLGKNKTSEDALADYSVGVKRLAQYADYMVINISSPNTPGLRDLQQKEKLHALIFGVQKELKITVNKADYTSKNSRSNTKFCPPLLIKISPDMTPSEMEDLAAVAIELKIDGIIISNTTIRRPDYLKSKELLPETGGLSGEPLTQPSNIALSQMYKLTKGRIPIIGVGGVSTAEDAYTKIKIGASLVQLYTSLIYEGPGAPANIKNDLIKLLKRDGYKNVQDAVGSRHSPDVEKK